MYDESWRTLPKFSTEATLVAPLTGHVRESQFPHILAMLGIISRFNFRHSGKAQWYLISFY